MVSVLWLVADCAECHGSQGCPADAVAAMVQGCEMTGCTAAQVRLRVREGMGSVCVCVCVCVCVGGGGMWRAESSEQRTIVQCAPTSVAVGLGTCDEAGLAPCSNKLSECIMHSGGSRTRICECRGAYDTCYSNAVRARAYHGVFVSCGGGGAHSSLFRAVRLPKLLRSCGGARWLDAL